MAAMMAVLRSCMESFKSILTSQEFGSEYELLCTELSTQWLRIRLWGESVGLHINDAGHLQNSLFQRLDIESTITQCVNNIAYLLTEIEVLRRKYELRPRLIPDPPQEDNAIRACKSLSTLSDFRRPAASLRQRIRDNQKQKSFLAITKWAMCDARKFDEKVKKLKNLVDGLEDISQAAGIALSRPPPPPRPQSEVASALTPPTENPPPYSLDPPTAEQSRDRDDAGRTNARRIIPSRATVTLDAGILAHHVALKRFNGLAQNASPDTRPWRATDKLQTLSNIQFQELRTDVYDEMVRRSSSASAEDPAPPSLPHIPEFHAKRNQARQKLCTLPLHRFQDLTRDVVSELERRFTSLQMQVIDEIERAVLSPPPPRPPPLTRRDSVQRYGHVDPHSPPPLLQHRASHPAMLARQPGPDTEPAWPLPAPPRRPSMEGVATFPTSRYSSSTAGRALANSTMTSNSTQTTSPSFPLSPITPTTKITTVSLPSRSTPSSSPSSLDIFKSFRVSIEDPTYKILPAALKKYNIIAPWEEYALFIVYGDEERCVAMDEKPLLLFKQLDKEGKKPLFMLRRISTPSPALDAIEALPPPTPPGGVM